MIDNELLEKLNNSRIGNSIRLKYLQLDDELIEKITAKTYNAIKFFIDQGNYSKIIHLLDGLYRNNVWKMTPENMSDIDEIQIDCELFEDGLTQQDMEDLKVILETFGIKKLSLSSIKSGTVFIDLPVEELKIIAGNLKGCDMNSLKQLKKLNFNFLEFSDITPFQDLVQLEEMKINMHIDDERADLSRIGTFQNLKLLKISGKKQTLNAEEAKSICKIEKLENFSATLNEDEDIHVIDFLRLPNLKSLDLGFENNIDYGTLLITSANDLKTLLASKYFEGKKIKILYASSEVIDPEWFKGKNVDLKVETTLALDDNFCKIAQEFEELSISVTNDSYSTFTCAEISAINDVIKEIISNIPENADDFTKLAIVYKILGERITYDHSGCIGHKEYIDGRENITRSLKGGLLENKLVCRGFSSVLHKILNELGVESTIVSGSVPGIENAGHAWNQVKIDNICYNLDLTWDAPNIKNHLPVQFFLVNDEKFLESHTPTNIDICNLRKRIEEVPELRRKIKFVENNAKTHIKECPYTYDEVLVQDFFERDKFLPTSSQKLIQELENISTEVTKKTDLDAVMSEIIERNIMTRNEEQLSH